MCEVIGAFVILLTLSLVAWVIYERSLISDGSDRKTVPFGPIWAHMGARSGLFTKRIVLFMETLSGRDAEVIADAIRSFLEHVKGRTAPKTGM